MTRLTRLERLTSRTDTKHKVDKVLKNKVVKLELDNGNEVDAEK